MPDFYLERVFAGPLTAETEQLLSQRLDACAREHDVRLRECLVDNERRRMLCRFEADDLLAARGAVLHSGLALGASWLAAVGGSGMTSGDCEPTDSLIDVIGERRGHGLVDATSLTSEHAACAWCFDKYRVQPGLVALSGDGLRVLAMFRAPDAEAVRMAYRHSGVSFDRVVALRRIRLPDCGPGWAEVRGKIVSSTDSRQLD